MFSAPVSILLSLCAVALLLHRIGMWATRRHLERPLPPAPSQLPALTLLKPIKGLEEELEANLLSFFQQRYPAPLQLVFASTDKDDPGMALARRLSAQYPQSDCAFIHSNPRYGRNPKVSNLQGALLAAKHDLVLQTDANVRIAPDYLARFAGEYVGSRSAMLGSLVVGVGERSLGAALDNLQLTAFTSPGCCIAKELANIQCVIGKSMMFRRSDLDRVGGLESVKDVLAEDFVLAQRFQEAGLDVRLSSQTVSNVNVDAPLTSFLSRHSRWLKMRAVVSVPGLLADLLSNPTLFAVLAWGAAGFQPRLLAICLAVIAYKGYWDTALLNRLRGHPLRRHTWTASLLRDLILPVLWVYALFSRSVVWRGERLQLHAGSRLTRDPGSLPVRLWRRVGSRGRP